MSQGVIETQDRIDRVEQPETAAQVAELLATATTERNPVRIEGGGGARALGNAMGQVGWTLSTTGLNRILDYQATDLTLSVEAGAGLAEVMATLAENGQRLPVDAPTPEVATIGGLLATGLTGPRRYGAGSLRDVLIGIAVAYPDGTVGKAGGMVVKNVSGFDMMRIHYGAMGTLGVMVSANFKVLPLPRAELTMIATFDSLSEAGEAADMLRAPALRPVALSIGRKGQRWDLSARYEGRVSGLSAVRQRLAGSFPSNVVFAEGGESERYWADALAGRSFDRIDETRIRISTTPRSTIHVGNAALESAERENDVVRFEAEPGIGAITLSVRSGNASDVETARDLVQRLRSEHETAVVTILTAPEAVKHGIDVWGARPDSFDLMRDLKREFDPTGILNPGCFVGSI